MLKLCRMEKPKVETKLRIRCAHCGEHFLVSKLKIDDTANHFCTRTCAHDFQMKITWPSDDKLKELVWREPVIKIAKQLNISDKAVKKHCRSRMIETPGPGYWAKQRSGSPTAEAEGLNPSHVRVRVTPRARAGSPIGRGSGFKHRSVRVQITLGAPNKRSRSLAWSKAIGLHPMIRGSNPRGTTTHGPVVQK